MFISGNVSVGTVLSIISVEIHFLFLYTFYQVFTLMKGTRDEALTTSA